MFKPAIPLFEKMCMKRLHFYLNELEIAKLDFGLEITHLYFFVSDA